MPVKVKPTGPDRKARETSPDFSLHARTMWSVVSEAPNMKALKREDQIIYADIKHPLSFFIGFKTLICRCSGSVLPHVLVEIIISACLGTFAFALTDRQADTWYDEIDSLLPVCDSVEGNCGFYILTSDRSKGHQIIGVLLAFLVVFRSQIAWSLYWEGRGHLGALVSRSRCLALEVLGALSHAAVEEGLDVTVEDAATPRTPKPRGGLRRQATGGVEAQRFSKSGRFAHPEAHHHQGDRGKKGSLDAELLAVLAVDTVRLIKLYYYAVVEHLRSDEGSKDWVSDARNSVQCCAIRRNSAQFSDAPRALPPQAPATSSTRCSASTRWRRWCATA